MACCIAVVVQNCYTILLGGMRMSKTVSMSIRVSEEELDKLKEAAKLEVYSSYSEFVRRTALLKATEVIEKKNRGAKTGE